METKNQRTNLGTTRFTASPRNANESKLFSRRTYADMLSSPFRVINGKIVDCDHTGKLKRKKRSTR